MSESLEVAYRVRPAVANEALNALFAAAWEGHTASDFTPVLTRSLTYVCAYRDESLVGFVNVAWDGGVHAFLLDTTVHPDVQRRGVGRELVKRAAEATRAHGVTWLHVDFEPHLTGFYRACGFGFTEAGLMRLEASRGRR